MTAPDAQSRFAEAIAKRRAAPPVIVPNVVAGQESMDGPLLLREDPSRFSVTVSGCYEASDELVRQAVSASRVAQREWARLPLTDRIARMRPAVDHVRAHVEEWAVRVALEIGKPYAAARAEAVEVLDILRLYLDYAGRPDAFEDPRFEDPAGKLANASLLRPYGVFGVITPFNYPIVQAANAAIAALIAGNGVVLKTSHLGPWSGHASYEMCAAMDLPVGLVNIVHGADDPGRALGASDIDGIAFTGSVAVGTAILKQFTGGPYPRPVIAEMGGKNPVIVTDTADLEQAADGIVFSAFDLAGQKCSALSRVLVTPGAHDRLVELVAARTAQLVVADPVAPDAFVGPVVDPQAVSRFDAIVAQAKDAGFAVAGGDRVSRDGHFVAPAVVSDVPPQHMLATTEHFLPFLTISQVDSFEEGMAVANSTNMGLTAGIYTGDLDEARTFLEEIEAGCINVNVPGHATTGWWPGPQTFGGWKGSGSTGKQGHGVWYIQQFARQQSRKLPKDIEHLLRG